MKIFSWRLIRGYLTVIGIIGKHKDNMDDSCPFGNKEDEDINNVFKNRHFCRGI